MGKLISTKFLFWVLGGRDTRLWIRTKAFKHFTLSGKLKHLFLFFLYEVAAAERFDIALNMFFPYFSSFFVGGGSCIEFFRLRPPLLVVTSEHVFCIFLSFFSTSEFCLLHIVTNYAQVKEF